MAMDQIRAKRQRLDALRQRRLVPPEGGQPGGVAALEPAMLLDDQRPRGQSSRGRGRQMMMSLVERTLLDAGEAGDEVIPGTNFTEAGVAKLMAALSQRADNPGAIGAGAAKRVMQFITEPGDGRSMVSGVNVEQLKKLLTFINQRSASEGVAAAAPRRRMAPATALTVADPRDQRLAQLEGAVSRLSGLVEQLTSRLGGQPGADAAEGDGAALESAAELDAATVEARKKSPPKVRVSETPDAGAVPAVSDDSNSWIKDYVDPS